ncbi:MAG: ATP-dependent Clp protease ATP-binding subunit ClpX [Micromonosporaceae bacterium]
MTTQDTEQVCSFCTEPESKVGHLVVGPRAQICPGCVELCAESVAEYRDQDGRASRGGIAKPRELRASLDEYIVGQDQAKRALSVAVYNHYKRVRLLSENGDFPGDVELAKSNVLLLGPPGSGKTLLAQTLARVIDVPFTMTDATALTQAGYVGEDVDTILLRLIRAAEYDIAKAQTGIVYIDEIDKCARRPGGSAGALDVSGEGVQQSLLKLLEGTVVTVNLKEQGSSASRSRRGDQDRDVARIDTSHILFILGGAFAGLDGIVESRVGRRGLGFGGDIATLSDAERSDLLADVTPEDLVAYGMIPEFIGRVPVITAVHNLGREALLRILQEPKNALVKQYRQLFRMDDVDLEFVPGALEAVADRALARRTGARSLRAVLETALIGPMYDLPSMSAIARVLITADVIEHDASAVLILRDGTETTLAAAIEAAEVPV